ncbi:Ulp1 protease family [Forsythia ovata]|uniref:Ulp1 protease family n=1 Tax=Forsythia ovata TaxID=205694 RepID=A0ABD1SI63_9LAMI
MSPSRSNNKSNRKNTVRHSSAAQKRNRRGSKARNKNQKKKFTITVKEGKKKVAQSAHDPINVQRSQHAGHKVDCRMSFVHPTPIQVHEPELIFNPEIAVNHHSNHGHTISEPDQIVGTEQQDPEVVNIDRIKSQIQKPTMRTNQSSQSAKSQSNVPTQAEISKAEYTFDSYVTYVDTFNSGDCGIFVIKYAEYIYQKKIVDMPNKFDTHMARYNMAVQLYKYAIEQPDLTLTGTS